MAHRFFEQLKHTCPDTGADCAPQGIVLPFPRAA